LATQDQGDRSRRVNADGDKNGLLKIITSQKFHPYVEKKEATIAGTVKTATNSLGVRGWVAQAVTLQLANYMLADEVSRETAGVEECACFNVTRAARSWSRGLAASRLIKKNRDGEVIVRRGWKQGCRHRCRYWRGLTSRLVVSLARPGATVIAGAAVVVVAVVKTRVLGRAGGGKDALVGGISLLETGEDEVDLILALAVG
jgi:hypothetical protein